MSKLIATQIDALATRLNLDPSESEELYEVLKATAFKGDVSNAQLSALLIVASQYELNPWTKEVYAFPDKGGIVPVVGVDGWARIINNNPAFDGMEFEQDSESCTCIIFRKDRAHPIKVTEWMSECLRVPGAGKPNGPWQSHPKRMLRHKAMIQCARLAFGFGGIFDADEAERIIEASAAAPAMKSIDPDTGEIELPPYSEVDFAKNLPKWQEVISSGRKSADDIINMVGSKGRLTEAQVAAIRNSNVTDIELGEFA